MSSYYHNTWTRLLHILIHIAIYALFITATVDLISGELTNVVNVFILVSWQVENPKCF